MTRRARALRARRPAGALLLVLALGAGGGALPAAAAQGGGAEGHEAHAMPPPAPPARFEPPAPGSYELPPIMQVSDHRLLAPDGSRVAMPGLAPGELAVVSFVYLSCGEACPLATATMHHLDAEVARAPDLAGRVQLVTVSFDPARDTPERMGELAASLHAKTDWRFLTAGSPAEIAPVLADFGQDAVWIPGEAEAPDRLRHVLKVFLVDSEGSVRNVYSTGLLDVRLVLADLRTLLR